MKSARCAMFVLGFLLIFGIAEGTILSIDITREGKIIFKGLNKDGKLIPIPAEDVKNAVLSLPTEIMGKWEFNRTFSLKGVSGSPIKVYVDTGDKVRCFLIESTNGEYKGPCR